MNEIECPECGSRNVGKLCPVKIGYCNDGAVFQTGLICNDCDNQFVPKTSKK